MHYELYIDVFFLVNFLMDYVLLLLTGKIARFRLRYLRIALGAGIGAALACVVVIFFRGNIWRLFLFHGVISFIMLKAGFEIKGKRMLIKAWILLYISALLLAGILNAFHPYIRSGCFFAIAAFAGYHLCLRIWDFLVYLRRRQEGACRVQLYLNGKMCETYVLIDTGNRLRDDLTGRPVHIIARETAGKLGRENLEKERVITYRSVGKENGTMPVLMLDRMRVECEQEEKWVEKPLVAVSEMKKLSGVYDMILNPDDI